MKIVEPVDEWLSKKPASFIEIEGRPVQKQLERYDKAGSGFGFITVLVEVVESRELNDETEVQLHVETYPVFKRLGEWVVVVNEDFADISRGLIRAISCFSSE